VACVYVKKTPCCAIQLMGLPTPTPLVGGVFPDRDFGRKYFGAGFGAGPGVQTPVSNGCGARRRSKPTNQPKQAHFKAQLSPPRTN
jgi:hypothetical protein